jgi:Protein of unknown function (DUF3311)
VPRVAWLLVILLLFLHQDWWQWENDDLMWDFLPFGLAWHVGISLAAAAFWATACFVWWPDDLDAIAGKSPVPLNAGSDPVGEIEARS